MSVVRAPAVLEIKDVRQSLLLVIFGADVLLLIRTIRTCPLACIVYPAHQVVIIVFLSHSGEISREVPSVHLVTLSDGVATQTATGLEEFLAMRSISRWVFGLWIGEARLPQIGGDGLDLVLVEAKVRHFCCWPEVRWFLQPRRDPVFVQFKPNILEIGTDLLHVL